MGGAPLARGALYHLLRNRLYLGEIAHGDKHYAGLHPAIIDAPLFEAVQKQLQAARHVRMERPYQAGGSPLTGLLFDAHGAPMSPTHARGKSGNPHRYYVSKSLLNGQREKAPKLARIPARALEDVVADRLSLLSGPSAFEWRDAGRLVERATLHADHLELTLAPIAEDPIAALREQAPKHDTLDRDQNGRCVWSIPLTLKRRGGAVRVLNPSGRRVVDNAGPDPAIVKALARAHRYRELLTSGAYSTGSDLARAEGLTKAMVYRTLKLAYLAPNLTRDFLNGEQRPGLTVAQLYSMDLPADWTTQRRLLGRLDASEK